MNEYNIKEGDIIKIGRIMIRIKTIKFSKKNSSNKNINKTDKNKNNDNKSINTNFSQNLEEIKSPIKQSKKIKENKEPTNNKLCRICYGEEESKENPLVQP